MSRSDELKALAEKVRKGGAPKYHEANAKAGPHAWPDRSSVARPRPPLVDVVGTRSIGTG